MKNECEGGVPTLRGGGHKYLESQATGEASGAWLFPVQPCHAHQYAHFVADDMASIVSASKRNALLPGHFIGSHSLVGSAALAVWPLACPCRLIGSHRRVGCVWPDGGPRPTIILTLYICLLPVGMQELKWQPRMSLHVCVPFACGRRISPPVRSTGIRFHCNFQPINSQGRVLSPFTALRSF